MVARGLGLPGVHPRQPCGGVQPQPGDRGASHRDVRHVSEGEREWQQGLLPSQAAIDYYVDGDLYMFDEFQTGTCELRRPKMVSLYDVFVAIRDNELAHAKTSECNFAKLTSLSDNWRLFLQRVVSVNEEKRA